MQMQSITSNPAVQKISVFAVVLTATALMAGAMVSAQTGNKSVSNELASSYSKDSCKEDGWKGLGMDFKNQGQCVSYFAQQQEG
jgi:hypothetical protein